MNLAGLDPQLSVSIYGYENSVANMATSVILTGMF